MALKFHPDKTDSDQEEAKKMFQQILSAYNVLKDPVKRKIYDKTGNIYDEEASTIEQFVSAYNYFRTKFPEIGKKDIDDFELSYRESKEEEKDLQEYFLEKEGNIQQILKDIMLSRNEDIQRFVQFFKKQIRKDPKFYEFRAKFRQTSKTIQKLNNESKMLEEEMNSRMQSLARSLKSRHQEREMGFLEMISSNYGKEPVKKGKTVLRDNKVIGNQHRRKVSSQLGKKSSLSTKGKKKMQKDN